MELVYFIRHIHKEMERDSSTPSPLLSCSVSLSLRGASQQSIMLRTSTVTRVAWTRTTRPSYWLMMGVWADEGARLVSGPGWRTTYPASALGYGVRQPRIPVCAVSWSKYSIIKCTVTPSYGSYHPSQDSNFPNISQTIYKPLIRFLGKIKEQNQVLY